MTFHKPKTRRPTRRAERATGLAEPAPPGSDLDLDRIRELETENALLRARVVELNRVLDEGWPTADREALAAELRRNDSSDDAVDAFLAVSDPHLDRVRRFLLG